MNPGYVYILVNEAMPDLIKIGFTNRSPEERKRELSRVTGVPIDYEIKYVLFTQDMKLLEQRVHNFLERYRLNKNKEFFKVDLYEGIDVLQKCADELRLEFANLSNGINEINEKYESIDILGELNKSYPNMIRKEINSIRVYQTSLRCYLEITEEIFITKYENKAVPLVDQKIHRQDLAFIVGNSDYDSLLFDPENSVSKNARQFLEEFDDYSRLVCCTDIFNDFGIKTIEKKIKEQEKSGA